MTPLPARQTLEEFWQGRYEGVVSGFIALGSPSIEYVENYVLVCRDMKRCLTDLFERIESEVQDSVECFQAGSNYRLYPVGESTNLIYSGNLLYLRDCNFGVLYPIIDLVIKSEPKFDLYIDRFGNYESGVHSKALLVRELSSSEAENYYRGPLI